MTRPAVFAPTRVMTVRLVRSMIVRVVMTVRLVRSMTVPVGMPETVVRATPGRRDWIV